jgi:hypothetical protein
MTQNDQIKNMSFEEALKELEVQGVKIQPSSETLEIIQDKFSQKQFLTASRIPVAAFTLIENIEDWYFQIEMLFPCLSYSEANEGKSKVIKQYSTVNYNSRDELLNYFIDIKLHKNKIELIFIYKIILYFLNYKNERKI